MATQTRDLWTGIAFAPEKKMVGYTVECGFAVDFFFYKIGPTLKVKRKG